jgi:hypothetical protein
MKPFITLSIIGAFFSFASAAPSGIQADVSAKPADAAAIVAKAFKSGNTSSNPTAAALIAKEAAAGVKNSPANLPSAQQNALYQAIARSAVAASSTEEVAVAAVKVLFANSSNNSAALVALVQAAVSANPSMINALAQAAVGVSPALAPALSAALTQSYGKTGTFAVYPPKPLEIPGAKHSILTGAPNPGGVIGSNIIVEPDDVTATGASAQ